jgi:hypothetical protein
MGECLMTEKIATLVETFQSTPLSPTVWEVIGAPSLSDGQFKLGPGQGLRSRNTYDLVYSEIFMAVGVDGKTNFLMSVSDAYGGVISVELLDGVLYFRLVSNGVATDVNVAYDPELHLYWKIRERDSIAYWETSADGSLWTVERQDSHGIDASNVQFLLMNEGA